MARTVIVLAALAGMTGAALAQSADQFQFRQNLQQSQQSLQQGAFQRNLEAQQQGRTIDRRMERLSTENQIRAENQTRPPQPIVVPK
ncbi:MAG: hypothetical protein AAGD34_01990 [Pseudomonadota bacterium]